MSRSKTIDRYLNGELGNTHTRATPEECSRIEAEAEAIAKRLTEATGVQHVVRPRPTVDARGLPLTELDTEPPPSTEPAPNLEQTLRASLALAPPLRQRLPTPPANDPAEERAAEAARLAVRRARAANGRTFDEQSEYAKARLALEHLDELVASRPLEPVWPFVRMRFVDGLREHVRMQLRSVGVL